MDGSGESAFFFFTCHSHCPLFGWGCSTAHRVGLLSGAHTEKLDKDLWGFFYLSLSEHSYFLVDCKPAGKHRYDLLLYFLFTCSASVTIERNFTRSSRGFSGSCACCKTLLWNSSRLSSRLMYSLGEVSVRVCGLVVAPVLAIVPGVATPAAASSSESNLPSGEAPMGVVILLDFTNKERCQFFGIRVGCQYKIAL